MDPMTLSMSYQKMKILISSIKNEIFTDIEIHKQNILPSFIDLPNLSAPIYSADLCSRLRAFLGESRQKLFHSYITCWIEEKRHSLLDSCRLDKVKCSDIKTSQSTTPFIDDMYDQLTETLNEYEIIISRWPEFTIILENYADVLAPLKDGLAPKIIGKYVQKFTKGTALGVLLNSMKRNTFCTASQDRNQAEVWYPCTPPGGNAIPGASQ
ncbi:Ribosomal protein L10 family protein isoform 2 [Gossypium australe]|uniref:Ribosomal protein L10 family protein isoform 2 n=1 Tax=Gossypium australe TaxID=47621 RepID=A0A5B6XAQ8_9ROSI|nr:Ribosomal protein L10 family protein isoform 2 [Gossypium australe]